MKYYQPSQDQVVTSPPPDEWVIPLQEQYIVSENSAIVDGRQIAWDSTSLASLRRCPRYYEFSILRGYREHPTPPALAFGIALHTVLEAAQKMRARGYEADTILHRSIRLAGLLGEYLPSLDNARSKESLIRTTVWYLDQFQHDPAQTIILKDSTPAVEYSFTLPLGELDGTSLYLCGHFDRVVEFMGDLYISDIKTTKHQMDEAYILQFKMSLQIRTYVLAAHILAEQVSAIPTRPAGALIDGIQLGVNFSRFQRFPITFTSAEIEDFLQGLFLTIREGWLYASQGHYPTRETGCFAFGGRCPFLPVCSKPPATRERELEARFVKHTWNPLSRRD